MMFRVLRADEIEVRVSQINEKGVTLLLYKDARCDMNILDEEVGPGKWQRKHYDCKGNLFCSVGLKIGDEWIWKDDCGKESFSDAQKGEASDSFKRACFNWGIGRELYTAPFVWVPAAEVNLREIKGKKTTYDKFFVEKIAYDDNKRITGIAIKNMTTGKRVFVWKRSE